MMNYYWIDVRKKKVKFVYYIKSESTMKMLWSWQRCVNSDGHINAPTVDGFNYSQLLSPFFIQSTGSWKLSAMTIIQFRMNDLSGMLTNEAQLIVFMQSTNDLTRHSRCRAEGQSEKERKLHVHKKQTHKRCDETRMTGDESLSLS